MNITDPIADMLTRIRNANSSKHKTVDIPASKMKLGIAEILYKEASKGINKTLNFSIFVLNTKAI